MAIYIHGGDIIFIKLTDSITGRPVTVSRNNIVAISEASNGHCDLHLNCHIDIYVEESCERIILTKGFVRYTSYDFVEFTTTQGYKILFDIDSIIYIAEYNGEHGKIITTNGTFIVSDTYEYIDEILGRYTVIEDRRNICES